MKILHDYIEEIEDELEGAKEYAEKYVACKSKGNTGPANMYKEMSHDELKHAMYMYDFALSDIDQINSIYKMPVKDFDMWEAMKRKYAEHVALIRQMLSI